MCVCVCYFETYRLSLGTRLSLRTRRSMVTLLAETHTLHLSCETVKNNMH